MKPLTCFFFAALMYFPAAFAQESKPEPTLFERQIQKPGAHIELEREVGSIRAPQATMRVSAIVVDDSAAQRRGGVRIDLEGQGTKDHVYLDEDQARTLQRELGWIDESIPAARADRSAPVRVEGTQSCWMPKPPTRILCPDYYVGPDKSAFRARALGGTVFEFPEHTPADLRMLIDQALSIVAQN